MSTISLVTLILLLVSACSLLLNFRSTVNNEPVLAPLRRFDTLQRCPSLDVAGHSEDHESMQHLIQNVQRNKIFKQKSGEWADACLWANVFCNENLQVTRISWSQIMSPVKLGGGSMDLGFIPRNVEYFNIGHAGVEGTLNAHSLPRALKELHINYCRFAGTIDWLALPPGLQILDVGSNQFTGNVALDDMPHNLFQLNISRNKFQSVTGDLYDNRILKKNRIVGLKEIPKRHSA